MPGMIKNENIIGTIIFPIIFITAFFLIPIFTTNFGDSSNSSTADGYTINSYEVILDVKKNNVIDVTEKITVNWYEQGHHGIYKFTPEWYKYTASNNKTIKRKSVLSNYRALGENYTVDTSGSKPMIKIGSASSYVPLGLKEYTIKYIYDMGDDPFKDFDAFIFHAFGDYWGTTINNATLEIHMPDEIDENNIKFWTDKYRENEITSDVDYYVDNNTLYASVNDQYHLQTALTVEIELPEGYFSDCNNNYGNISFIICIMIIITAIITFILWLKYGKNYDKVAQTIEFYAPEDYDAAQIGYIYGFQSSKKLTIALIVQLASMGIIKINETEDKLSRTIINLYPKKFQEKELSNFINAERRTIKVIKIKEADNSLTGEQKTWMKYLFKNGDTKDVITGFDKFYEKSQFLIDNNYLKVESDSIEIYNEDQIEIDDNIKEMPKLTEPLQIVYDALFLNSNETEISEDPIFYLTFSKVAACLEKELKDKLVDKSSKRTKIITIIIMIIEVISYFLAWVVIEDLNPSLNYLYTSAFIALLFIMFFSIIMGRKTKYGESIVSKVYGFRNYIQKAEKDQIDKLVEENPNYFYDILPYAYVMNVSRKWIESFENIPEPNNSMGNFDYTDLTSLDRISSSVSYPSSSSGSSGGGGCSSCGGGCSSCGGGGSW